MGKFAMACPKCGNYVTAYNGLRGLIQNKITCECGCEIDVRAERMSAVECPHCGNSVIYDQGSKIASCPVCKNKIEAGTSRKMKAFHCPQCGIGLTASEGTRRYTCPVCDCSIDVQQEMVKENVRKEGVISTIKYEGGDSDIVWKHPIEDFRTGSQLIVHESQEAIFFRDGQALDSFSAGRYTLETQNLPLLDKVYHIPSGGANLFHAEVYYINKAQIMNIKWGTDSKVRVTDPESGILLEIGASGEFNIKVSNSRKLLFNLVGTQSVLSKDALLSTDLEESSVLATGGESLNTGDSGVSSNNRRQSNTRGYFRTLIMSRVKSYLARTIRVKDIPVRYIDEYIDMLSEELGRLINTELEEFGLSVTKFSVARIVTPDDDPNWRTFKQQLADERLKIRAEEIKTKEALARSERKAVEAETARNVRVIEARGEAEAYLLKSEAEAREMQMKGYTYADETKRMVGLESMKNGLTGAGGSGAGGLTGELMGLGIGLAGMKNVADFTQDALSGLARGERNGLAEDGQKNVNPAADGQQGGAAQSGTAAFWVCPKCGNQENTGKFCNECGSPKPAEKKTWDCPKCGNQGNTGKFCSECGSPKPAEKETWDCPKCGSQGNTGKFCSECGQKKPEAETAWDCPVCGNKNNMGKFCNECGTAKEN